MGALAKIRDAGFTVTLDGEGIEIVPASALTPNQRQFLKSHRAEIIEELRAETGTLSANDRQKLLAYLAAIGETDRQSIDEYLTECGKDAAILSRALQQADDCLRINSGDVSGLAQCSGCRQLSGDTCQRHGWRVVVDKWRRCSDFEVLQKTPVSELITCKACSHFQSYHPHGGGAGSCAADVQSFGACWWADTVHTCDNYLVMENGKRTMVIP